MKSGKISCEIPELIYQCLLIRRDNTQNIFADEFLLVYAFVTSVLGEGIGNQFAQLVLNFFQRLFFSVVFLRFGIQFIQIFKFARWQFQRAQHALDVSLMVAIDDFLDQLVTFGAVFILSDKV